MARMCARRDAGTAIVKRILARPARVISPAKVIRLAKAMRPATALARAASRAASADPGARVVTAAMAHSRRRRSPLAWAHEHVIGGGSSMVALARKDRHVHRRPIPEIRIVDTLPMTATGTATSGMLLFNRAAKDLAERAAIATIAVLPVKSLQVTVLRAFLRVPPLELVPSKQTNGSFITASLSKSPQTKQFRDKCDLFCKTMPA